MSTGLTLVLTGCGAIDVQAISAAPDATVDLAAPDDGTSDMDASVDVGLDDMRDASDAPPADGCFAPPGGSGEVTVENLRTQFVTPNGARLRWDAADPIDLFFRYEVRVLDDSGGCRVIGPDDNPVLALFQDVDREFAVIVGELFAESTYEVQLLATDEAGQLQASSVLEVRTPSAPSDEVVLFAEANTSGFSLPASFVFDMGSAHRGANHYTYESDCGDPCFENLRRQEVDVSTAAIPEASVEDAYFEFAVSISGAGSSLSSQARLWMDSSSGVRRLFLFRGFSFIGDGSYHVYQIPLQAMRDGGDPISFVDTSGEVFEFGIGSLFEDGSIVRVDELRIRW